MAVVLLTGLAVLTAASVRAADAADASRRLVAAAARGDAAQVAALLREGAAANARDEAGRPAVVAAARSGRPEALRALLQAGADPDAADRSAWTALHQAVEAGDLALARLLLDGGATPDLLSRDRGTALDVAERTGRTELAQLLRARGARGSGKSIGDTVCVRPWHGDGFCGVVEAVDPTRFRLRVSRVVGCQAGCTAEALCSAARLVGGASGLGPGDVLWVPGSCLTHTGVR
jgi:hypothetical protein